MMSTAVPLVKAQLPPLVQAFADPLKAVASGHTAASRSFCAYWLRAVRESQNSPYPPRKTILGENCQARPTRGPQLSLMGGGAKKGLPATTTLLKCGSFLNASGMQGAEPTA